MCIYIHTYTCVCTSTSLLDEEKLILVVRGRGEGEGEGKTFGGQQYLDIAKWPCTARDIYKLYTHGVRLP